MDILASGNTKLGPLIRSFNMPPVKTCPGATAACRAACYAFDGYYNFQSTKDALKKRFWDAHKPGFAQRMISEIHDHGHKIIRIHASGDFDTPEYTQAWVEIAKACPDVVFYTYTRSWRVPEILRVLNRFRRLPNVQLWWSTDREAGQPPEGKIAYMSIDDQDAPAFEVDMVFRVKRDTVKVRVGNSRVCPKENGKATNGELTCSRCRLCFSNALRFVQKK